MCVLSCNCQHGFEIIGHKNFGEYVWTIIGLNTLGHKSQAYICIIVLIVNMRCESLGNKLLQEMDFKGLGLKV